ncbi:MAG: RNA polymerase sigma factor [Acidobacteriota bacterium]
MPMNEIRKTNQENMAVVQGCISKDPEAYDKIYSLYNRKIFNTAFRILGEESSAEDALQETMLNVYKGISNFRGEAKISTWISRITINVCLGILRKNKKTRFVELDDEYSQELNADTTSFSDPLAYASRQELKSHIRETFKKMTAKQAIVVRLHDMEGNTIEEIAEIIRCPVGTVKSRLFYGRQEFKALFKSLKYSNLELSPVSIH